MKKITSIIIAAILTLSALCSCGGSSRSSSIVGKWEEQGGGETIEFFDDGTMVIDGMGGSYSIEGNRLKMQVLWGALVCDYNISGDVLKLTEDGSSSPDIYKRAD